MRANDEFFTPEEVDEQIDFLSQRLDQEQETNAQAAHVISHLRQLYTRNSEKNTQALERAWNRIIEEHQFAKQTGQEKGQPIFMQKHLGERQERQTLATNHASYKRRPFAQRLSILAAVVFLGILVGSMIFVLNTARQSKGNTQPVTHIKSNTHTGSDGKHHPKPPNPIVGGKCTLDTTIKHPQQSTSSVPGLYVFALNNQGDNILYRYDMHTKKVVWSVKFCAAFQSNGTIEHNGILYLAGIDWTHEATSGSVSYLYALNDSDGSVIWGTQFPTKIIPVPTSKVKGLPKNMPQSSPIDLGMIETPTIVNGTAYVVQRSGIVYALDAATGSQLWTYDTGRNAWATTSDGMGGSLVDPSSIQVINGVAYGAIVDRFFALDAQSGKELWKHSFNKVLNINQAPAIANGMIYLTVYVPGYGSVANPDTYIYAFDAQTGIQKWVTVKMRGYINGPTALNGKIYIMSYDGIWYTLNPSNGSIESRRQLPDAGVGAPVAINGVLYNITNTTLSVLNPDGSARWSVPVTGGYPTIDDVQNGIVYVSGRDSGIYAYSATNGALLWHYKGYLPQPDSLVLVTIVA